MNFYLPFLLVNINRRKLVNMDRRKLVNINRRKMVNYTDVCTDYLMSWNFKHIVNIQRIRGYNSINIKFGYKELEIRSPRDFMIYENNN